MASFKDWLTKWQASKFNEEKFRRMVVRDWAKVEKSFRKKVSKGIDWPEIRLKVWIDWGLQDRYLMTMESVAPVGVCFFNTSIAKGVAELVFFLDGDQTYLPENAHTFDYKDETTTDGQQIYDGQNTREY